MSFAIAPSALISDRRLGASDLRVLLALLTFARPDRPECWPSRETIGSRCGITSESRISKILARLSRLGWITIQRRQGSNLYRIHPPPQAPQAPGAPGADPEQPCTPSCTPAIHPVMHPKETREGTKEEPLTPKGESGLLALDQEIIVQPEADEPQVEPDARQERHQAAVRIINHINQTTGQHLPTDGATARLIRRRLAHHIEQDLIDVVNLKRQQWKGTDLERHLTPRTLFKPTALEGYVSEVRQLQEQRQRRLQVERQQIEAMRQPTGKMTREGAMRGLAAVKAALGMRPKATDGDQMQA